MIVMPSAASPRMVRLSSVIFNSPLVKAMVPCKPGAKTIWSAPGWEAIKVTRGHYRSCGKDPHACCVSALLSDRPLIISDAGQTRVPGKDTGRYWEAGAANVHWVVATDEQVEEGVRTALEKVTGPGVFVEGASFLKYIDVDYSIMVASPRLRDVKSSAIGTLRKMDALIINCESGGEEIVEEVRSRVARRGSALGDLPILFLNDLRKISAEIGRRHEDRCGISVG